MRQEYCRKMRFRPEKRDLKLFLFTFVTVFAIGCVATTIRYRNFDDPKAKHINVKPSVELVAPGLDRLEVFAGGVHVGTFYFDGQGSVFVGDGAQAAGVLQELLTYLEMVRSYMERDSGESYY
jgi:hypothetical protein